jgi:hypothetical protein
VIDGKIAALSGNRAPGDARNLLFAALILADGGALRHELTQRRGRAMEDQGAGRGIKRSDVLTAPCAKLVPQFSFRPQSAHSLPKTGPTARKGKRPPQRSGLYAARATKAKPPSGGA